MIHGANMHALFFRYAVSQLRCSSTEFTEVELILGGCCFKFPDQLGIWAVETGGEIHPPSAITVNVPLSKAAVLNAVIFKVIKLTTVGSNLLWPEKTGWDFTLHRWIYWKVCCCFFYYVFFHNFWISKDSVSNGNQEILTHADLFKIHLNIMMWQIKLWLIPYTTIVLKVCYFLNVL